MFFSSTLLLALITGSNAYIQLVVRTPEGQPQSELEGYTLSTVPIQEDDFLPDISNCDPLFMLRKDAAPTLDSRAFWSSTWLPFHNPGASNGACKTFPCSPPSAKKGKPPAPDMKKDWTLFNMGRWESVAKSVNPAKETYFLGKMAFLSYSGKFDYEARPEARTGYMEYSTCRPKDFFPSGFNGLWSKKTTRSFRYVTMNNMQPMLDWAAQSPFIEHGRQYPIDFGNIPTFTDGVKTQFTVCWSNKKFDHIKEAPGSKIKVSRNDGNLYVYLHGLANTQSGMEYLKTVYRHCENVHFEAKTVYPEATLIGNYGHVMSAVYDRNEFQQKINEHEAAKARQLAASAKSKPMNPDVDDENNNERYKKFRDSDESGSDEDDDGTIFKVEDEKEKDPWDEVDWEDLAKQKDPNFGPKTNI